MLKIRYDHMSKENRLKKILAAAESGSVDGMKDILRHDKPGFLFHEAASTTLRTQNAKAWETIVEYAATIITANGKEPRQFPYQQLFMADVLREGTPEMIDAVLMAAQKHTLQTSFNLDRQLAFFLLRSEKEPKAAEIANILIKHGADADKSLAEWDRCLAINLSGTFYAIRSAVPALLASGGGAIVNLSSMMGQIAHAGIPAYVASKHGVVGLTKVVALDYAKRGIRCNAIGPGNVDTAMTRGAMAPPVFEAVGRAAPVERYGTAEEIAELISFLCSPRASFITGAYVVADGGFVVQ